MLLFSYFSTLFVFNFFFLYIMQCNWTNHKTSLGKKTWQEQLNVKILRAKLGAKHSKFQACLISSRNSRRGTYSHCTMTRWRIDKKVMNGSQSLMSNIKLTNLLNHLHIHQTIWHKITFSRENQNKQHFVPLTVCVNG